MAPLETYDKVETYVPFLTFSGHITASILLTLLVARTIYRSYLALPPSAATRHRQDHRRKHVKLFAALAGISFLSAVYWKGSFAALSYRVWAAERGVVTPTSLFGDRGALRGGYHPGRLHLARWLSEIPIYHDALEIVAEKARRVWWGEQLDLATLAWGMLVGIEGRRRKIPHLWAFMLLSQLVSLSFAQNIFALATLLTPVPLPDNVRELTDNGMRIRTSGLYNFFSQFTHPKPDAWCPSPILYLLVTLLSQACVFLTPFAHNTPSFMTVALMQRAMAFLPIILPHIVPERWGTVHPHPHEAHSAYRKLFRTMSIISTLLHWKSSLIAGLYNAPDSHYHRHNLLHPFRQEKRTLTERTSTAVGKVLGAIDDHPAVSAVGWDVIMSGLTIGLWAVTRGLDVERVLASTGLWYGKPAADAVADVYADSKSLVDGIEDIAEKSIEKVDKLPPPGARRSHRSRKSIDDSESVTSTGSASKPKPRARKSVDPDPDFVPSEPVQVEGDVEQDDDWEAGALVWGLISMFGLGAGTAAVCGGETTAR